MPDRNRTAASAAVFVLLLVVPAGRPAVQAAGPPALTFALLEPFPALQALDETGASFDLADHADKLVLLHFCASWCAPCQNWTNGIGGLYANVVAAVGAENVLFLDVLVEGPAGFPSTQTDASNWKNAFGFPGPVLHAGGSADSALYQLWLDLLGYHGDVIGIPFFFVLEPDCEARVAARGNHLSPDFAEESNFQGSYETVEEVLLEVWNERRCPGVPYNQLDRCSTSAGAPSSWITDLGVGVDSAESFSLLPGESWLVEGAVVVGTRPVVPHDVGEVWIFRDQAGLPGPVVCSWSGVPLVPETQGSLDLTLSLRLAPGCLLTEGNYWIEVRMSSEIVPWEWRWSAMSIDDGFAFRDPSDYLLQGCTSWTSYHDCVGEIDPRPELCVALETGDLVFGDNFESGDFLRWD